MPLLPEIPDRWTLTVSALEVDGEHKVQTGRANERNSNLPVHLAFGPHECPGHRSGRAGTDEGKTPDTRVARTKHTHLCARMSRRISTMSSGRCTKDRATQSTPMESM